MEKGKSWKAFVKKISRGGFSSHLLSRSRELFANAIMRRYMLPRKLTINKNIVSRSNIRAE